MESDRLVALTDGVIAVIITIMVLEMKAPAGAALADLGRLWPVFVSYLLSFVYVAIYWNNHHHFARLMPDVTGAILWANLHLLFWLSLVPFATAWIGEHARAPAPTALYGLVLLACALAWLLLQQVVVRAQERRTQDPDRRTPPHGAPSALRQALGRDRKGKASFVIYVAGIALAFFEPLLSDLAYAAVAVLWVVPDRRIEAQLRRTAR